MRIEQSEIGDCVPSPWGEGKQDVKTFTRSVGKRERLETLNAACECGWPCANTRGNSNGVVSFSPALARSGYAGWHEKMKTTLKELDRRRGGCKPRRGRIFVVAR